MRYPGDLEETFLIRWLIEKSLFLQHVPVSDNIERLHAFVEARLKELDGTYRFTSNPLFDLYQQKLASEKTVLTDNPCATMVRSTGRYVKPNNVRFPKLLGSLKRQRQRPPIPQGTEVHVQHCNC